jgi:uncharacterized protein (TIGR00106 family)
MVMMDFSVVSLGNGESMSDVVADALKIVKESGLDFKVNDMGTTVNGPLQDCIKVLENCTRELTHKYDRIYCISKFDSRSGKERAIGDKTRKARDLLNVKES